MDSDSLDQPLFSAADWLAHQRARGLFRTAPPESVIFVFQRSLFDYARRQPTQKLNGLAAEMVLLKRAPGRIAVVGNFGMGAPAVAALAEQLAAWGVRRFVSIGLAGGLQADLRAGEVVVCARAVRDEGTSAHYGPPGQWAEAAPEMVVGLSRALHQRGHPHGVGESWTTDAPFRELRREVMEHQRAGVLTVEMEAAALFAVAQALSVSAVAAFVIADTLADGQWQWSADARATQQSLRVLFEAALDYLGGA